MRIAWWMALGLILIFIPYFYRSKHLHLFLAPLNHLLKTERQSMGQLDPLELEDVTFERFGAYRIEDLSYDGLLDAYACIMCNRCQDACPAYQTGKVLSPAALEINKRYFLKDEGKLLARGQTSIQSLTEFAISYEAIWACTACGACVGVCPVADEPMRDILEIRRHMVLMENHFPEQLQNTFRGMERTGNPWGLSPEDRLAWAEDLEIPLASDQDEVELLWWVGCAPATDPRAQKTARAFATILKAADLKFSILGPKERCTGDSARRAGNEYLYLELAEANVQTLNQISPKRIVTTCPHCLHTIKNEYPASGGEFHVLHHSELIDELLRDKKLTLQGDLAQETVTYHDPCFLGRQNGILEQPREILNSSGTTLIEMADNGPKSFCCGAGGAQMWKEEEQGVQRVSHARLTQAKRTGAKNLSVACPFCMIMLTDAEKEEGDQLPIQDIAEWVAERLASTEL
jgi:Fe-S oxidoreductase